MTTIFECDWCGDIFKRREQVASVDMTVGCVNEQLHACAECVPEYMSQHFPEERTPVG